MKKIIAILGLGLITASSLLANTITGTIGFTGRTTLNSTDVGTATMVTGWVNPTVNGTSGDFASIADGTAVTLANSWNFDSGPVSGFWSVGGYIFNLTSSTVISRTTGTFGAVNVSGVGIVSGNGFSATTMDWNFSSQNPGIGTAPNTSFTFSASGVSTPDHASTGGLLGASLASVGFMSLVSRRARKIRTSASAA